MSRTIAKFCCAASLTVAVVCGIIACSREEKAQERSPIARVTLPVVGTSPGAPPPAQVAKAEPTVPPVAPARTESAPPPPAPPSKEAPPPPAPPAASPTAAASAVASPAVAASPAAAPASPSNPLAGTVGKGVDLRVSPSLDARVRGTFEGRTDVEVIGEKDGFSLVRAPVVTGGFVEGWVVSSSVRPPGEEQVARAPVARPPVQAKPATGGGGAKPADKGGAPAAQKAPATSGGAAPAPSKPAAKPAAGGAPANKGPANIKLVPIAGTSKKQPATPFTHKAHYDDYSIGCAICHHSVKAQGGGPTKEYTCSSSGCHEADKCNGASVGKKNTACPNFEDAFHMQCIGCHRKDGGPTKCKECHTG